MKISNFLDPVNPKTIREFNRWLNFSIIAVGTCIGVITSLEFFQIWHLLSCRSTHIHYHQSLVLDSKTHERKNQLATQEQGLKTKINTITNCADNCEICIGHLNGLKNVPQDVRINSYTTNEQSTTITIACPTIQHAQHYIINLAAHHKFNNLAIWSVQPNNTNSLTVTLKAD